jgi:phospholipid/cholesterol/gamma-HCH transport system permease protein
VSVQAPAQPAKPPNPVAVVARETVEPVVQPLRLTWDIAAFSLKALRATPGAFKHGAVIVKNINDIAVGSGAFLLGAGTIVVMIFMTAVLGIQVSLEGTKGLELIGAEGLIGFVSAFANIREIAPLGAGIIFAAQIGANFTAELGAMRVSDEIDALEVMSIPAMRFLVATRLLASYAIVLPLYAIGLYVQLEATKITATRFFDVAPGIYSQYFDLYLPREDVIYSVTKCLVFITLITFIHCYYGFSVRGGPEDVGRAVGRSVRLSVTLVFVVNFFLSLAFFGASSSIRFSG